MRLKIRGGTADFGEPSLCLTCRFATVIKGQRLREEIVECSRLSDDSRDHIPCQFLHGLRGSAPCVDSRDGRDRVR